MWDEDWIRSAFQACENVGTEVIDGADEIFVAHKDVGECESEEDGADPCANKACSRC